MNKVEKNNIRFVTRPVTKSGHVPVSTGFYTTSIKTKYLLGFIPVPVLKTEFVPTKTVRCIGKMSIAPFTVINWPYKLGVKIESVVIEDLQLNGVFASKRSMSNNTYTCYCDVVKERLNGDVDNA